MVRSVLLKMAHYFGNDVKRITHALKVYGFAQAIIDGEKIPEDYCMVTELAAILHDIGIKEAERKDRKSVV